MQIKDASTEAEAVRVGVGGPVLAAAYPLELRAGAPRPRTPGWQPRGRGLSLRGEVRRYSLKVIIMLTVLTLKVLLLL